MHERAKAAGGALTIWSGPERGTEVAVRWPEIGEQETI